MNDILTSLHGPFLHSLLMLSAVSGTQETNPLPHVLSLSPTALIPISINWDKPVANYIFAQT